MLAVYNCKKELTMHAVLCPPTFQAVGQEMQDSAMHLRQDVEQLQKSLIAAHAEESETHKVLANCRAQLTISNRDLDIVATSLGELLSRTEMLVVSFLFAM